MKENEQRVTVHLELTFQHRALLRAVAALHRVSQAHLVASWVAAESERLGMVMPEGFVEQNEAKLRPDRENDNER
ncbi:hypothetical protein COW53_01005 [bacterium CG17_big_fil_post_rev_8_21_14_2_50_64_8]|nr:MAG: hypothetical protein COW53_01005 [bacterium CG17_big_fil_post_rev_8_21_14_2_50_64_8]